MPGARVYGFIATQLEHERLSKLGNLGGLSPLRASDLGFSPRPAVAALVSFPCISLD
jgi:hypothetical protein